MSHIIYFHKSCRTSQSMLSDDFTPNILFQFGWQLQKGSNPDVSRYIHIFIYVLDIYIYTYTYINTSWSKVVMSVEKDRVYTKETAVQYPFSNSCICSKIIVEQKSQSWELSAAIRPCNPSGKTSGDPKNHWPFVSFQDRSHKTMGMFDVSQNSGEELRLMNGWLKNFLPRSEVFSLLEMMFGQVPPGDLPVAPPQEIVLKPGGPGREVVARWIWPCKYHHTNISMPYQSNGSFWISASSSSYSNIRWLIGLIGDFTLMADFFFQASWSSEIWVICDLINFEAVGPKTSKIIKVASITVAKSLVRWEVLLENSRDALGFQPTPHSLTWGHCGNEPAARCVGVQGWPSGNAWPIWLVITQNGESPVDGYCKLCNIYICILYPM